MARKDDKSQREPSKTSNNETVSMSSATGKKKEKGKEKSSSGSSSGKDRLLSKMNKITDWITTSEPSTNAFKQHKKEAFQKAGISLDDAEASAKLHAPIGEIPPDAVRSNAGPTPEEVAKRKAEQRRRMKQQQQRDGKQRAGSASASGSASFSGASSSIQTPSLSGYSSMSGAIAPMFAPGDDDFGANGWGDRQL